MNKIKKLIKQLCPDGVEYKTLNNFIDVKKGQQLNKEKLLKEGKYPVINGGKGPSGYWNEFLFENDLITISQGGASAGFVYWQGTKFWAGAHCYVIVKKSNEINYKFIYYFLKNNEENFIKSQYGAGIPSLNKKDIEDILIPIPPLSIQEEIVKILDKMTELNHELNHELNLRKKQYEYYRDKLLDFSNMKNVKREKLEMHINYIQPSKYIVSSTEYNDEYKIPVLTPGKSFILGYTNEDFGIYNASKKEPIILFDDFTCSFHWVDFPFKVKSSASKILLPFNRNNVNFRFIYYMMKFINFESKEHTRKWINEYSQLLLPIPPLQTQNKIVEILDKFSALVENINEGIPKEIALRNKQYEYYRDKLLRFDSD